MSCRVAFKCVTDPEIPVPDASCDAVFSCEVFQHFDSDLPFDCYLGEAFRVLQPGGTLCFQVPVHGAHAASFLSSRLRLRLLRVLRKMGRRRMMMYRHYRVPTVLNTLRTLGFRDLERRMFQAEEQPGFHAYFFARKP